MASSSDAKRQEETANSPEFETMEMFDGITVALYAREGVLPEGTYAQIEEILPLEVSLVHKARYASQSNADKPNEPLEVASASEAEKAGDFLFDISFYDSEGKKLDSSWGSKGKVEVEIFGDRMDEEAQQSGALRVTQIKEDGAEETVAEVRLDHEIEDRDGVEAKFQTAHSAIYRLSFAETRAKEISVPTFEEFEQAIKNAQSAATIQIAGSFTISDQITIEDGQDIVLLADSEDYALTVSPEGGFLVKEGGKLSLEKNLKLVGDGDKRKQLPLLEIYGSLQVADNATIEQNLLGSNTPLMKVYGKNAVFTMSGGAIQNNNGYFPNPGGMILLANGAKFDMQGGKLTKNTDSGGTYGDTAVVYVGINGTSDVAQEYNLPGAQFLFSGGEISENTAGSAVLVGEINGAIKPDLARVENNYQGHTAVMEMSDGASIIKNIGGAGGGVFVRGPGRFTMSGGKISGNVAQGKGLQGGFGGGVATFDAFVGYNTNNGEKTFRDGVTPEDWQKRCPASFTMTGGEISDNAAEKLDGDGGAGGGVYVSSFLVQITGGKITGNEATQGGGIYVSSVPYVLKMADTLITENHAKNEDSQSGLGGGIWLCPTGSAQSFIQNGVAIFDNGAECSCAVK